MTYKTKILEDGRKEFEELHQDIVDLDQIRIALDAQIIFNRGADRPYNIQKEALSKTLYKIYDSQMRMIHVLRNMQG